MLEFGVIGLAHWIAVGEGHEQRPGWFDLFRMLFDQSDDDGWQTGLFEHPGDHTHGVGTKGSNRHQQDQVNVLGMHGFRRLRTGFLDDLSGVALGAHEGVIIRGQAADNVSLDQLAQPVHGKG